MAIGSLVSESKPHVLKLSVICALIIIVSIQGVQGEIPNSVSPQRTASLTEWTVPTPGSGPWMLTHDQSGKCCWFVEYYGNKIGHLDPETGSFQEWSIPTANSNPYSLALTTVNDSVMLWGTEFSSNKVFAFTPDSGQFSEYSIPGAGPEYIAIEPQPGTIRVWFTEITKNSNGEFVYDPSSRNVTFYDAPFPSTVGGGAHDLYAGPGYVWFAGFSALVKWDRASGKYTIWPLPNNNSAVVRSLAFDSRGELWYTQGSAKSTSNNNFVGVLHGDIVQEWRIPSAGSNPRGISVNPITQQPWIAEQSSLQGNGTVSNLNNFGNGTIFLSSPMTAPARSTGTALAPTISRVFPSNYSVASTTGSIAASTHGPFTDYALGATLPSDLIADSSGNLWVSEPGANKIVRLSLSSPDYALSPSSSYISLAQGSSISLAVTVTSVLGYSGHITLSALNLPTGITVSAFDPNPVEVQSGGTASSNLEISVAGGASPGTDSIMIKGNDGTTRHTIGLILTITNSSLTSTGRQLETRCLVALPIYLPQSTLLLGLLIDVLIGASYIGLPLQYFSRRLRSIQSLSRETWLLILLLAPSLLSLLSAVLLVC